MAPIAELELRALARPTGLAGSTPCATDVAADSTRIDGAKPNADLAGHWFSQACN